MAILSKYRKNKKEARNSVMPQGSSSGLPKQSGEFSTGTRQLSNTSGGSREELQQQQPQQGQQMRSPSGMGSMPPQQGSATSPQEFRGPLSPTPQNGQRMVNDPRMAPQPYPQSPRGQQPPQQQVNHPHFPWSQNAVKNASPFPRYGHAANPVAARDGEVFIMGGLKGSNVFGDLWVVETDTLTGYLLDTDGCPSPRVGHAALTLGNAFIVFGGDTKIEENDVLDDNLYLLNTTTLKWTVAKPSGPRPSGRYGHTISTIGSKVYIFGGQLDDYFFDDLICYDLTTLRSPDSHWELIQPATQSPPPRTNHTVVTYQDRLYLFGGTDGKLWYSDTWCYDPQENSWTLLECSGYIPSPCEGHSATIVGDIMYIFGGRSSQGKDLGTLSALKLTTKKWYTFQNLGPGPTPRSGHSMTAFGGHKILVMGGESPGTPSAEDESESKNHTVFVLDTSKINYPPDNATSPVSAVPPVMQKGMHLPPHQQQQQYPPAMVPGEMQEKPSMSSLKSQQQQQNPISQSVRSPSGMSEMTPGIGYERVDVSGPEGSYDENHSNTTFESVEDNKALPAEEKSLGDRESAATMTGKPFHDTHEEDISGKRTPDENEYKHEDSHIPGAWNMSNEASSPPTLNNDTTQASSTHSPNTIQDGPGSPYVVTTPDRASFDKALGSKPSFDDGSIYTDDIREQSTPRASLKEAIINSGDENTYHTQEGSMARSAALNELHPNAVMSNGGLTPADDPEQPKDIHQALERLKASNTWYESELAAARDAGYVPASRPPVDVLKLRRVSQRLTGDSPTSLQERDILVAALAEVKEELQTVQADIKEQAEKASERISNAERERDDAVAKLQAYQNGSFAGDGTRSLESVGSSEAENVAVLETKIKELQKQLDESNKSRTLLLGGSEDSDSVVLLVDRLKSDNINLEMQLRSQTDKLVHAEHELSELKSSYDRMDARHRELDATYEDKVGALAALSASLASAQSQVDECNRQLEEHRLARSDLENKVGDLERLLDDNKTRLATTQRELEEHQSVLGATREQNAQLTSSLNEHVNKIVTMWGASKVFARGGSSHSNRSAMSNREGEELSGEEEEEDPRYEEMQRKMDEVTKLHESHRAAATRVTGELTAALNEVAELKQQLAFSEDSKVELQTKLAKAIEESETHRSALSKSKAELGEISDKHRELEAHLTESDSSNNARVQQLEEDLREAVEKSEKKQKEMEEMYNSRYNELEEEYEKSLQYFKNIETALTKTRDDLAKYKDANGKLQSELDELRLRTSEDSEDQKSDQDRVASPLIGSGNKYSSRQVDMQIRDLKAQIIILQEEREDLRNSLVELKKKHINASQDLEEANAERERLMKQLKSSGGNHFAPTDPESGETLDTYDNELEQLRNEREQYIQHISSP
ncbi:hypothetical protein TRVA0_006S02014 [Trichomonascus vanleenenianus]|uniref:uncharacterized protein n=1 Tax=Trichomonascus vanleenenianus TaxID=2268995 RepID=UPI003ECA26C2